MSRGMYIFSRRDGRSNVTALTLQKVTGDRLARTYG